MKKTYTQKVSVMNFEEVEPGVFKWVEAKRIWTSKNSDNKNVIYSPKSKTAPGYTFYIHPTDITPHNMLKMGEDWFFVISAEKTSPVRAEIKTARINLVDVVAQDKKDGVNRYKNTGEQTATEKKFPAILANLYIGYNQNVPMPEEVQSMVLITPKEVELAISNLVNIQDKTYYVRACHVSNKYQNEYEIYYKGDVT